MGVPLTLTETARILRLHPETVRRLLATGKLPGRKLGKTWRVSPESLQRFMDNDQQGETTQAQGFGGSLPAEDRSAEGALDSSAVHRQLSEQGGAAQDRIHQGRSA